MKHLLALFTLVFLACNSQEPEIILEEKTLEIKDENFSQEGEYITETYESGINKNLGRRLNGKRHGLWKMYYPDGVLWSESVYKEDVLDGPTKVYYPTGILRYQGRFKNGKRTGKWIQYDEEGKVKHEDQYN